MFFGNIWTIPQISHLFFEEGIEGKAIKLALWKRGSKKILLEFESNKYNWLVTMSLRTESNDSTSCFPFLMCFQNLPRNYHYDNFFLAFIFINALVAVTATCCNFVVIYTISSTASLRTPSNVVILGLAISDFAVGVIAQPSYCIYLYSQYKRDIELMSLVPNVYLTSWNILAVISLLTLSFITANRFLAVYIHLRYNELVTKRRYCIALTLIWFFCVFLSVVRMLVVESQFIIIILGIPIYVVFY
jgi:hypothetical protein